MDAHKLYELLRKNSLIETKEHELSRQQIDNIDDLLRDIKECGTSYVQVHAKEERRLLTRIDDLEDQVDSLEDQLTSAENRCDELEEDVDYYKEQLNDLRAAKEG